MRSWGDGLLRRHLRSRFVHDRTSFFPALPPLWVRFVVVVWLMHMHDFAERCWRLAENTSVSLDTADEEDTYMMVSKSPLTQLLVGSLIGILRRCADALGGASWRKSGRKMRRS